MAKTRWNEMVMSPFSSEDEHAAKEKIRILLRHASEILNVIGPEGDDEGQLQEVKTLQDLLDQ
jgi:hypothetical protein